MAVWQVIFWKPGSGHGGIFGVEISPVFHRPFDADDAAGWHVVHEFFGKLVGHIGHRRVVADEQRGADRWPDGPDDGKDLSGTLYAGEDSHVKEHSAEASMTQWSKDKAALAQFLKDLKAAKEG